MSEEEKEDYLKYIENYTLNDLADEFNTQNFIIKDKDKFNEILLYYHFKEVDEIEQLQQENKKYKEVIDKAMALVNNELYRNRCDCTFCNDYYLKNMRDILKEVE